MGCRSCIGRKCSLGKKDVTPYWRALKLGGKLNEEYPGGAKAQKKLLEDEGRKVVQKGKKYFVENYELFLVTT